MTCPTEYKNVEEKQIVVWVDPLDGTKEYTEGILTPLTSEVLCKCFPNDVVFTMCISCQVWGNGNQSL